MRGEVGVGDLSVTSRRTCLACQKRMLAANHLNLRSGGIVACCGCFAAAAECFVLFTGVGAIARIASALLLLRRGWRYPSLARKSHSLPHA